MRQQSPQARPARGDGPLRLRPRGLVERDPILWTSSGTREVDESVPFLVGETAVLTEVAVEAARRGIEAALMAVVKEELP